MHLSRTIRVAVFGLLAAAVSAPSGAAPGCGSQEKRPADQRVSNNLSWVTKREVESKGFDVFRGDSKKGSFTKLNKDQIPAARNSQEPKTYSFADDSIDPCKSYFYFVEVIGLDGKRRNVTGMKEAKPKVTPNLAEPKPVQKSIKDQ